MSHPDGEHTPSAAAYEWTCSRVAQSIGRLVRVGMSAATAVIRSKRTGDDPGATVVKRAKPTVVLTALHSALKEALYRPDGTGLSVSDIVACIWHYANSTYRRDGSHTVSYPNAVVGEVYTLPGTSNLFFPGDIVAVPYGSDWNGDSKGVTFLVTDLTKGGQVDFHRYCREEARSEEPFNGIVHKWETNRIEAMCFDPNEPNRLFVTDSVSIYSMNSKGVRTPIARSPRFQSARSLVCSMDTSTLYVMDMGAAEIGTLRALTLADGHVRAVLDVYGGRQMCWDMTYGRAPYSVLYIRTNGMFRASGRIPYPIKRFDIQSRVVTKICPIEDGNPSEETYINPAGTLVCTPGGFLLVARQYRHGIYSVDLNTHRATRIAGLREHGDADGDALSEARLCQPRDMVLLADEHALVVVDRFNHRLRSVPLPAHLFAKPVAKEAALLLPASLSS